MTQSGTSTATKSNGTTNSNGDSEGAASVVRSGAAAAADTVRQTAEKAAARLPDAVAGAQVAARDTQKALDGMDDKALLIGTSFSLGLGVGLFLTGANRLLVALALAPAGAMVMTIVGREKSGSTD
ncbi:MAG: hypothetical protein ABI797_08285 [Chloroflexota bacterium]